MRVMAIVKATPNSEKGGLPDREMLAAMQRFNEDLVKAGVMQMGDGLRPTRDGRRVRFSEGRRTVVNGPFTPPGEQIAGFWIWNVRSLDDAVEWVMRCPEPMPGEPSDIEIRPFYEIEDFGPEFTPELKAREERLRDEVERRNR